MQKRILPCEIMLGDAFSERTADGQFKCEIWLWTFISDVHESLVSSLLAVTARCHAFQLIFLKHFNWMYIVHRRMWMLATCSFFIRPVCLCKCDVVRTVGLCWFFLLFIFSPLIHPFGNCTTHSFNSFVCLFVFFSRACVWFIDYCVLLYDSKSISNALSSCFFLFCSILCQCNLARMQDASAPPVYLCYGHGTWLLFICT